MGDSLLQFEQGQVAHPFEEMTDSGDLTNFDASFYPISEARNAPVVAPYGLVTGGAITPDTGTNDSVAVAALTVMAPGMTGADADGQVAVSADTVSITRGLTTDTHCITSITVNSSGTLAAVAGTDGTAFSETRGAEGGPPYIPVGSIEIGQVRTTSVTAADVLASEIYTVDNVHREMFDQPGNEIDNTNGRVKFYQALPAIHTGDKAKKVYIKGESPIFATVQNASNWSPAETTSSTNSQPSYDGPVGVSTTDGQSDASFTAFLKDGSSDPIAKAVTKTLWFKFQKDRDKSLPYQLTLGKLTTARNFPAGAVRIQADFTIGASFPTVHVTE